MITVIIPYFQREPGVLRRALLSIVAQQNCQMPVEVIVVDDSSPIPAEDELNGLGNLSTISIRCIHQPNGGPGAARNTGLLHASLSTKYIAFLDSDDEWSPTHLQNAVIALQSGHHFYFADHLQLGAELSAFRRAARIVPEAHPAFPANFHLHSYKGDMFDQIVRGNVIGTSTVVYDFAVFKDLRFKVEFTNVGEDYLFWIDLVLAGAKCAFSEELEAIYGRGVNVYAGSGWGSELHLLRVHNEIKFKKLLCHAYPLNKVQKKSVEDNLSELRQAFARDILHRIKHQHKLPIRLLGSHLTLDPMSFLMMPANVVSIFRKSS